MNRRTILVLVVVAWLVACTSSASPTVTPTSISTRLPPTPTSAQGEAERGATPPLTLLPPPRTPHPTTTPSPAPTQRTLTQTPPRTQYPTFTSVPTHTPGPTLTPYVLTSSRPTDREIALFLRSRHLPTDYDFIRQDVDVDGDGQTEILLSGLVPRGGPVFVAILDRVGDIWQERLYVTKYGHYCADVRATVEKDRVVVDFLTCGGGTGVFALTWEQRWIQCQDEGCDVIWSAPLLDTVEYLGWSVGREYAVTEMEQLDAGTIRLTTRRFGVKDILVEYSGVPLCGARRVVGPDKVETYRWDGAAFRLGSREQIAPGVLVAREFDLLTRETTGLVYDFFSQSFKQPDGTLDLNELNAALAAFWGGPSCEEPDDSAWGSSYRSPDVAAHNGRLDVLGEWVAGAMGVQGRSLCCLTVGRRTSEDLKLVGRIELPCTANFTRLAWADLTGDGSDELLLLTLPPDLESPDAAGVERLHIYTVGDELTELAALIGAINDSDGVGVRWEDVDGDGTVEVLAGLHLVSLGQRPIPWPDLIRRFQVYRWDTAARVFAAGEIQSLPAD